MVSELIAGLGYELKEVRPGVYAYSVKEAMRGPEPEHKICANCFAKKLGCQGEQMCSYVIPVAMFFTLRVIRSLSIKTSVRNALDPRR
jgi:hypothetical protein